MSAQSNDTVAVALPWRKITGLHRALGARSIRIPLILAANTPQTILRVPYGPDTIDRIVSATLLLGFVGEAISFSVSDLNSGYVFPIQAGGHPGNYGFPIETLLDGCNISVSSSINITASMFASICLHNFESPPFQIGHSG